MASLNDLDLDSTGGNTTNRSPVKTTSKPQIIDDFSGENITRTNAAGTGSIPHEPRVTTSIPNPKTETPSAKPQQQTPPPPQNDLDDIAVVNVNGGGGTSNKGIPPKETPKTAEIPVPPPPPPSPPPKVDEPKTQTPPPPNIDDTETVVVKKENPPPTNTTPPPPESPPNDTPVVAEIKNEKHTMVNTSNTLAANAAHMAGSKEGWNINASTSHSKAHGNNLNANALNVGVSHKNTFGENGENSVTFGATGSLARENNGNNSLTAAMGARYERALNEHWKAHAGVAAAFSNTKTAGEAKTQVAAEVGVSYKRDKWNFESALQAGRNSNVNPSSDPTSSAYYKNSNYVGARVGASYDLTDRDKVGFFAQHNRGNHVHNNTVVGLNYTRNFDKAAPQTDPTQIFELRQREYTIPPKTEESFNIRLNADNLFTHDKADLKPEGKAQLARVATMLLDNNLKDGTVLGYLKEKGQTIKIDGFTDATGKNDYNQNLSERRAQAVTRELVNQVGDRLQLSAQGREALKEMFAVQGHGESKAQYNDDAIKAMTHEIKTQMPKASPVERRAELHARIAQDRRTDISIGNIEGVNKHAIREYSDLIGNNDVTVSQKPVEPEKRIKIVEPIAYNVQVPKGQEAPKTLQEAEERGLAVNKVNINNEALTAQVKALEAQATALQQPKADKQELDNQSMKMNM